MYRPLLTDEVKWQHRHTSFVVRSLTVQSCQFELIVIGYPRDFLFWDSFFLMIHRSKKKNILGINQDVFFVFQSMLKCGEFSL